MKIKTIVRELTWKSKPPETFSVSFTGGMGAQIISASIYNFLRSQGNQEHVFADLSYFDTPTYINNGEKGKGLSKFPWQLNEFGLRSNLFKQSASNIPTLKDGSYKLSLFMDSYRYPQNISYFQKVNHNSYCRNNNQVCIHIRQGDFIAVASHQIHYQDYLDVLKLIHHLTDEVLIVSDSEISNYFLQQVKSIGFSSVNLMISGTPMEAYIAMQSAGVLITANSQFSLTAGLFSDNLVFVPNTWVQKTRLQCLFENFLPFMSPTAALSNQKFSLIAR